MKKIQYLPFQFSFQSVLSTILTLSFVIKNIHAFYTNNGPVTLITPQNYMNEVLLTEKVVLLEFFAPWCGHCQRLTPEYIKAAENLKGLVKVAAIDCDDQSNRNVCSANEIKGDFGFPTIKLFPSQSIPDPKNPKKFIKRPKDYNGPRTAKDLVKFALEEIPSFVQPLAEKTRTKKSLTLDEFLDKSNGTISKAILFTSKDKTTHLYKALSVEFHNRMLLAEVRKFETTILERFNITDFPKFIVIPKDSPYEVIEFTEKYSYDNLSNFLNKYALPKSSSEPEPFNPEILEVKTQSDLIKNCLKKSSGVGVLCVFTILPLESEFPESVTEHQSNVNILKKVKESLHVGSSLKNKFDLSFLWLNSLNKGAQKLIKDFKLSDVYPTLMILNPNKNIYAPYLGPFEVESIQDFIKEVAMGFHKKVYEVKFDVSMTEGNDKL
ncbi:16254_t:CDS:2 [Entrophospora sp. SA101]|nr:16254_t:CDS:2 [Entrophospora sp. SA101]